MKHLLKNGMVFHGEHISRQDVLLDGGVIAEVSPNIVPQACYSITDCQNLLVIPGFADVHVHLREPCFSVKETIQTGTMAAPAGGYSGPWGACRHRRRDAGAAAKGNLCHQSE